MITFLKYFSKNYLLFLLLLFNINQLFAQEKVLESSIKFDSIVNKSLTPTTNIKEKHNPKIATRRSLILPGWGQAYNKEYWKIPIIYGVLAIPTVTFFYNNTIYKEARFAYDARYKAAIIGATNSDSTDYFSLETRYQKADINAIQSLRNAARRDRDYSVLWFLLAWGLNIADATVFGHLKDFDVSDNLTLNVRPNFDIATKSPTLNFALKLKNKKEKNNWIAR